MRILKFLGCIFSITAIHQKLEMIRQMLTPSIFVRSGNWLIFCSIMFSLLVTNYLLSIYSLNGQMVNLQSVNDNYVIGN